MHPHSEGAASPSGIMRPPHNNTVTIFARAELSRTPAAVARAVAVRGSRLFEPALPENSSVGRNVIAAGLRPGRRSWSSTCNESGVSFLTGELLLREFHQQRFVSRYSPSTPRAAGKLAGARKVVGVCSPKDGGVRTSRRAFFRWWRQVGSGRAQSRARRSGMLSTSPYPDR